MQPRTAKQLIEDEVKEYRKELMRGVTKRSELKADGFESYEIDQMIQEEKDDFEQEVAEYKSELMAELPERERQLAEERIYTFASAAFNDVWLPKCLTPLSGEVSTLVTKEVYEYYLTWCEEVSISEPYSLGKVRSSLKDYYCIENIRTGLRNYRLGQVSTTIDPGQLVARREADIRQQKKEAEKLQGLTCPYCERRTYDGSRFDRCYWCHRILKDGLDVALSEYLSDDVGWERTGGSMHLAHQRMVAAGEIEAPVYKTPPTTSPLIQENQSRKRKGKGMWGTLKKIMGL